MVQGLSLKTRKQERSRQSMLVYTVTLVFLAAAFLVLRGRLESSFIYFPQRGYDMTPEPLGLHAEKLSLRSGGGPVLRGWWIRGGGRTALLYFHGNGGNASHRLERAKLLVESLGADVVLVDYRGYGESEGNPSEPGLYEDGEAVYRCAAEHGFGSERIVLFGESLGCAVAIEIALRHPCRAVILETPFLSIPAMAKQIYPWLPSLLLSTRFDNEAKISRISAPKLIVAAEKDEVVPPAHARRLFEMASQPKDLCVVRGATHNDVSAVGGVAYRDVWRKFLERL